jgi:hypothetical protein
MTTPMNRSLHIVTERFPERAQTIKRLFTHNESFHCLCDDYLAVVDLLQKQNDSTSENATGNVDELRTLMTELEQEMFIYFKEELRRSKKEKSIRS